jgi:hypothetical protein
MARVNLHDLPPDMRRRIEDSGISQPETWIHDPVPALGGASISEMLRREGGEATVREYLDRIEQGFPTGHG